MRLLFKQRFLSWFDSYDIYDEEGRTAYTVEGKLSWGHRLEIYGPAGDHLGTVKEEVLTLLPRSPSDAGGGIPGVHPQGICPVSPPVYTGLQRLGGGGQLSGVGLRRHRPGGAHSDGRVQGAAPLDRHLCAGHRPAGGRPCCA